MRPNTVLREKELTFLLLIEFLPLLEGDLGSVFGGVTVNSDNELFVAGKSQDTVIVHPLLASSLLRC